jgi:hypothetical protein
VPQSTSQSLASQFAGEILILGGAAVYRCDKSLLLIAGFSPRGLALDFFQQTLQPLAFSAAQS